MRLRFLESTEVAGLIFEAGETLELLSLEPEHERWIADGRAELLEEPAETATAEDPETAVSETPRKGPRKV